MVTAGLTKKFGERAAVDGLDLKIPKGCISGFVGPNGAGKTTTIRMLLGLIRPTSGDAVVLGRPLAEAPKYLRKVGALIEGPTFYPTLTGRANLEVLARLSGLAMERVDEVLDRVGLGARGHDPFRTYSLGMRQRLGIAAALLPAPELLVLDEPTNGLDPHGIAEIRAMLRSFADDGMTVFVSSHLLSEIQQVCEHLVVIETGRLVFQGGVEELLCARAPELVVRPERAIDCARLLALVEQTGRQAKMCPKIRPPEPRGASRRQLGGRAQPDRHGRGHHARAPDRAATDARRGLLRDHRRTARRRPAACRGRGRGRARMSPKMVIWSVHSEFVKLRRRRLWYGTYAAITGVVLLTTVVTVLGAHHHATRANLSLAQLALASGLRQGLTDSAILLGAVSLAVAAAQFGGEYTHGTLRNLLVRQPRRLHFLAGKVIAVLLFLIGGVMVATVVGLGAAFAMAHLRGLDTSQWTSGTGLSDLGVALGDMVLAVAGFATVGMVLGVLVRSSVIAIAAGLALLLPVETILTSAVPSTGRWLPGQLLEAIADGGRPTPASAGRSRRSRSTSCCCSAGRRWCSRAATSPPEPDAPSTWASGDAGSSPDHVQIPHGGMGRRRRIA